MTESVALFTFYNVQNAVNLVEEHTQEQRTVSFFVPEQIRITFLVSSHVCMREYLARSGVNNVVCSSSILKRCCSLCEA